MDDITSFSHRRLATILKDPNHPHHAAAKAEKDRRNMQREGLLSFKNFDEATYTDTGWQKPKKDTMSKSDGMQKAKALAKKGQSLAKVAASGRTVPTVKPVKEVSDEMKARYIRAADGSHRAAHKNEREAIIANKPEKAKKFKDIMKKRNAGMTKAFGEAFGRANFTQQLKKKGMDVDKMHSNNIKDADAAKKRSAAAEKDLVSFRKKSGINSESKKEATIPDGQTVMTKSDPVKKNDMDKLAKIRKMLDHEKKK